MPFPRGKGHRYTQKADRALSCTLRVFYYSNGDLFRDANERAELKNEHPDIIMFPQVTDLKIAYILIINQINGN